MAAVQRLSGARNRRVKTSDVPNPLEEAIINETYNTSEQNPEATVQEIEVQKARVNKDQLAMQAKALHEKHYHQTQSEFLDACKKACPLLVEHPEGLAEAPIVTLVNHLDKFAIALNLANFISHDGAEYIMGQRAERATVYRDTKTDINNLRQALYTIALTDSQENLMQGKNVLATRLGSSRNPITDLNNHPHNYEAIQQIALTTSQVYIALLVMDERRKERDAAAKKQDAYVEPTGKALEWVTRLEESLLVFENIVIPALENSGLLTLSEKAMGLVRK